MATDPIFENRSKTIETFWWSNGLVWLLKGLRSAKPQPCESGPGLDILTTGNERRHHFPSSPAPMERHRACPLRPPHPAPICSPAPRRRATP